MRRRQSLGFKLIFTGSCFLLLALASIGVTLWVTWQLEGGAAAVNEVGRMRMMTYRMALDARSGDLADLAKHLDAMDATFDLLRDGDPSRPLFIPSGERAKEELAELRTQWMALRLRWRADPLAVAPEEATRFVGRIDGLVTLVEQHLARWTTVLRSFQLALMALALVSAFLVLYATQMLLLEPLRRMAAALSSVHAGDFDARVEVASHDEFGELGRGFNAMAQHLQSLYRSLESKVREKTARLEVERERLQALYDVSGFVARCGSLDELGRGFAARIRRTARADAVAIRWADEGNAHYLMLAQEGLPPALVRNEQCVSTGDCHCGQPAATSQVRVIPIRSAQQVAGPCDRAGFAALVTVPVVLHDRVLGEVDLFYRTPHALGADELALVEALAGHLAGGIEALRAVAAAKEAAVAGERTLIAQELHDSIAQSLAFMKMQVGLLRDALRREDGAAALRTVDELDAGVRESYGDVRELLMHFRTRTNAEDIEPALRTTLQKFEHQTGLATTLSMQGRGVPLPTDVQVQVLHVIQEALSNVRKHAGARHVHLRVEQAPRWHFEVSDDGSGFDRDVEAGIGHVGLRIMRERAERIGAQLQIASSAGKGTCVSITVSNPVTTEEGLAA